MLVAMTMESRYPFGSDWIAAAQSAGADVVVIEVVLASAGIGSASRPIGVEPSNYYRIRRKSLRPDRILRPLSDYLLSRQINAILDEVKRERRVDVIHTHFYREMAPIGWLRGRLPHVHTEHSAAFSALDLGGDAVYRISPKGLKTAMKGYASADAVMAVSEYLRRQMQRYGVGGNIDVVSCPMDPVITARSVVEQVIDPKMIVTVSRLAKEKRIDLLFRALGLLREEDPGFRLIVIGSGPEEAQLKRLASDLGLDGSVKWVGKLSRADLAEQVSGSGVFASATLSETFGTSVAEALCLGVPVVASAVGGLPEFFGDDLDRGEIVSEMTPHGFADAIRRVTSREFDRCRIAEDARSKYSHENVGTKLMEIYQRAST